MTIRSKCLLLVVVLAASYFVFSRMTAPGDAKPVKDPIVVDGPVYVHRLASLQAKDSLERQEAYKTLLQEHELLTDALIAMSKERTKEDERDLLPKRELAIKLLAAFGCRDAIPVFIKHIDYHQQMAVSELSFLNGYPCALALRKIGQTSVPHIIRYLQVPEADPVVGQQRIIAGLGPVEVPEKQIELFAWLFLELYGQNEGGKPEALRVVRGARDRAFHKENLTRLVIMLETLTDPKKSSEFIKKTYRPED